jgi:D-3-phosphoglycerate dehydrogenase
MKNVLITTLPFGKTDKTSINLLKKNNINYYFNPNNKKFSKNELLKIIDNYDGIICGTDKIDRDIINKAKKLKIISRVGIGLNNLDLKLLKKNKIKVTYTPEVPTQTVAEYTIGLMIYLLRKINVSRKSLKRGEWLKIFGKNLNETKIGIIGLGRIGSEILNLLKAFHCKDILVNDVNINIKNLNKYSAKQATKNRIFKNCDLITIHLPITEKTKNLVTKKEIAMMSNDTILINTSRGGIINEDHLYNALKKKRIYFAALDVFAKEPYFGRLRKLDNCHCTTHIASMSISCRNKMELEATQEIVRFFKRKKLMFQVPEKEYKNSIWS